jgi:hypothetical protein
MTLDPQAAAELSQEITLVTRALFAQLLPRTAAAAVGVVTRADRPTDVPGPHPAGVVEPVPDPERAVAPLPPVQTPVQPPVQAPVQASAPPAVEVPRIETPTEVATPAARAGLPVPAAVPVSIPVEASPAGPVREPVPGPVMGPPASVGSLPIPGLAVPGLSAPGLDVPDPGPDVQPVPAVASHPSRRSTAVLEEIAFLDE